MYTACVMETQPNYYTHLPLDGLLELMGEVCTETDQAFAQYETLVKMKKVISDTIQSCINKA